MSAELTPSEQLTLDSYNRVAIEWTSEYSDQNYWQDELNIFQNLLPTGRVLEVGCGGGRDAKQLIVRGYSYIGTDISEKLLKQAKKKNPRATFYQQSVYGLDFPQNHFDGFWACAVLLHLPKDRIDQALSSIHQVMKPDGVGFIAMKRGQGEMVVEDETTSGIKYSRFFSLYSEEEFEEILNRNNFAVVFRRRVFRNDKTTWLNFFTQTIK